MSVLSSLEAHLEHNRKKGNVKLSTTSLHSPRTKGGPKPALVRLIVLVGQKHVCKGSVAPHKTSPPFFALQLMLPTHKMLLDRERLRPAPALSDTGIRLVGIVPRDNVCGRNCRKSGLGWKHGSV